MKKQPDVLVTFRIALRDRDADDALATFTALHLKHFDRCVVVEGSIERICAEELAKRVAIARARSGRRWRRTSRELRKLPRV